MPATRTNTLAFFNRIGAGLDRIAIVETHGGFPTIVSASGSAFCENELNAAVQSFGFVQVLEVVHVLCHPVLVPDADCLVLLPVAFVGDGFVGKGGVQIFPGIFGVAFFNVFGTR